MHTDSRADFHFPTFFSLILIGFGLGWLMGLSVSPVLQIVLTTIMTTIGGIAAALSGLEEKESSEKKPSAKTSKTSPPSDSAETTGTDDKSKSEKPDKASQEEQSKPAGSSGFRWKVNPWPVAGLLVGIFFGSVLGIWVRTHNTLGVQDSLEGEYSKWAATGMSDEEIARQLFITEHPYTPYMLASIVGSDRNLETKQATIALGISDVEDITQTEYITLTLDLTQTGDFVGAPGTTSSVRVTNTPGISLTGNIVAHIISDESDAAEALKSEVEMWEALGLEKNEVASRLFDLKYPIDSLTVATESGDAASKKEASESTTAKAQLSVLFDVSTPAGRTLCNELLNVSKEQLREQMQESGVLVFEVIAANIADDQTLKKVVEELCPANS